MTPRRKMASFLSELVSVFPIDHGVASTDEVVFEPDNFLQLLNTREIPIDNYWSFCAEASNAEDATALLNAMLNDWIDFVFLPSPARFAIYADHDEYLTIYVPISSALDQLVTRLELVGFRFEEYVRPSQGYIWR